MSSIERYHAYKEEPIDLILMKIKHGEIKCGKHSKLVKIDKKHLIDKNQKEFFGGNEKWK